MKELLYNFFVRKNENVRYEYEYYVSNHIQEHYSNRVNHWIKLLELNLHYRILKRKGTILVDKVDKKIKVGRLPYFEGAESLFLNRSKPQHLAKGLLVNDIISFDIFDTLILRPFSSPSDLFSLVGIELDIVNYKNLRIDAEREAREIKNIIEGNREINIYDIYSVINKKIGIDIEFGVRTEFEIEKKLCFANPYMKRTYDILVGQRKKIIAVSDMYYPQYMMKELLDNCGYVELDRIIVSCDYKVSKSNKLLYDLVLDYVGEKKLIHIGDNKSSDIANAKEKRISTIYYENVNEIGNKYRAESMSPIVGSAYAGIVNAHLHNGLSAFSPYYEYGFTYAGLYITGYCSYIERYCRNNNIEKVLFLSRDGDIYHKVFNKLYKEIDNEYVYWSRIPAIKSTVTKNRDRFFLQVVKQKAFDIRKSRIGKLLDKIELGNLKRYLGDYNLKEDEFLSAGNYKILENLCADHWNEIVETYEEDNYNFKEYFKSVVGDRKSILVVDVGWTGNVVLTIKDIINEVVPDSNVKCMLAGIKGTDKSESAPLILTESVLPYIFSQSLNSDIHDYHHNTNKRLNTFLFEMMTQSNSSTFIGEKGGDFIFDIPETENYGKNNEIHEGIMDFADIYSKTFKDFEYMLNISGYDAYMPFKLLVKDLTFIKKYFNDFHFGRGVLATSDDCRMETVKEVLESAGL
jgi:predicted HAD superfamily hydrolase